MNTSEAAGGIDRVRQVIEETAECPSAREIAAHVVDAAVDILDGDAAVVCTIENDRFRPLAAYAPRIDDRPFLNGDDGIAGRSVREDRTLVVDDLTTDARVDGSDSSTAAFRSVVSVPFGDGVLQVLSRSTEAFDSGDVERGELLASVFAHARERVESETTANRERDRFVALFENLPDPALQYTNDGGDLVIDQVNTAFVHVFGYEAEEVLGECIRDVLVPNDATDSLESETDPGMFLDREVDRLTTAGPRPFLVRRVPITADQGYCIYADITDLKEREQELQHQNELLNQFAKIVSHDLRNPLSVAQGYLEMLEEGDANEEYYERISMAHDRMGAIIEDVLAMTRHKQADGEIEFVSLASTARDAWQHVPATDASLVVEADCSVRANESRLKQVFENLFRNALEHGEAETVTVGSLPTSTAEGRDVVGFYVADDGSGIPTDVRDQVFDSGYSATDGHGIGLAIVSTISESFDWDVVVDESKTGGARFEFHDVVCDSDETQAPDRSSGETRDSDTET